MPGRGDLPVQTILLEHVRCTGKRFKRQRSSRSRVVKHGEPVDPVLCVVLCNQTREFLLLAARIIRVAKASCLTVTVGSPIPAAMPMRLNLVSVPAALNMTALMRSESGNLKNPEGTSLSPHRRLDTGTSSLCSAWQPWQGPPRLRASRLRDLPREECVLARHSLRVDHDGGEHRVERLHHLRVRVGAPNLLAEAIVVRDSEPR